MVLRFHADHNQVENGQFNEKIELTWERGKLNLARIIPYENTIEEDKSRAIFKEP